MKKDVLIPIVGVAVVVALCYALSLTTPHIQTPSRPFSAATGPNPVGTDNIVMRVNGEPVSEREFNLFISSLPEQMQPMLATGPGRRQAADELVKMKVLEQEGRRLGSESDPDVAARMKFGHVNVGVDYALHKLAGKPDEAALRAQYEQEKAKLEVADLSHILLAVQGGGAPTRNGQQGPPSQVVMQRAMQIENALKQGTDFATIARAASDDTASAQQGGRLGPIPLTQLPPDVVATVSKLQPGQVSEPVRTQFGVHIFKLNAKRLPSFDEVRQQLVARSQQTTVTTAVDKLQKTARVELDPKFFSAKEPAAPPKLPQRPNSVSPR